MAGLEVSHIRFSPYIPKATVPSDVAFHWPTILVLLSFFFENFIFKWDFR